MSVLIRLPYEVKRITPAEFWLLGLFHCAWNVQIFSASWCNNMPAGVSSSLGHTRKLLNFFTVYFSLICRVMCIISVHSPVYLFKKIWPLICMCFFFNYIIWQLGSQTLFVLTGKYIQQKSCNTIIIRTPLWKRSHTCINGKELTKALQVHFDLKSWLHPLPVLAYVMLCCVTFREMTDFTQMAQLMRFWRCGWGSEGSVGRPLLLIATHMCSAEVGLQISVWATPPLSVWMLPTQTVRWPLWLLEIWPLGALLKLATCSHAWTMTEEGTLG